MEGTATPKAMQKIMSEALMPLMPASDIISTNWVSVRVIIKKE